MWLLFTESDLSDLRCDMMQKGAFSLMGFLFGQEHAVTDTDTRDVTLTAAGASDACPARGGSAGASGTELSRRIRHDTHAVPVTKVVTDYLISAGVS